MPAGRLYGVASPASKTSSMETETAWGVSDGYLQERYPINNTKLGQYDPQLANELLPAAELLTRRGRDASVCCGASASVSSDNFDYPLNRGHILGSLGSLGRRSVHVPGHRAAAFAPTRSLAKRRG